LAEGFIAGEYPSGLSEALPEIHVQGSFAPWDTKGKYKDLNNPLGLYRITLGEGNKNVSLLDYQLTYNLQARTLSLVMVSTTPFT